MPLLIHHIKSIPRGKYLPLFIVGICGSGLPAILYAIGQTHIQSAVAGVLNSLTPVFTFILAVVIFKQRFIFHQLAGITLALLGIMVLFFIKVEGSISVPVFYAALILMATLFYAISANTVKAYLGDVKPIMISVVSFAMIGPFALIYLINSSFIEHTTQSPGGYFSFGALLILSLICTFLANILFFRLIQLTDAIFSTSVSFLIPFVALLWGFFDGELLSLFHLLALILILSGIFLIRKK